MVALITKKWAYYNDVDPFACAWARELIKAGLVAPGEVDERPIQEVQASDLNGFIQCHFFCGILGWSLALRLAGWDDDRAVWTGSCPCQPFSSAGAQAGGHDPRDLWPVWFQLVKECRPVVVFGEQVEAALGHGWLDRLCDDLEAEDYAVGACGLPGPCVGAFDIRQRLWFVAESNDDGRDRARRPAPISISDESNKRLSQRDCATGELAESDGRRESQERAGNEPRGEQPARRRPAERSWAGTASGDGIVADSAHAVGRGRTDGQHRTPAGDDRCGCWNRDAFHRRVGMYPGEVCVNKGRLADNASGGFGVNWSASGNTGHIDEREQAGELGHADTSRREARHGIAVGVEARSGEPSYSSFWSDADWLPCTDGKARPVEPGTFPLAHGVSARVGRLRGYGNAIKPQVAQVFIEAYMSVSEAVIT